MILPFPHKKGINEFGASRSEIKYPRMGQQLAVADSTTANLTSGNTPTVEEEMTHRYVAAILPLKLPQSEKHLLTVMALHTNELGESWCSKALLAKECCLSERQVQRLLSSLTKRKIIVPNFRYGRSTVYNIPLLGGDIDVSTGGDTRVSQNVLLNGGKEACSPRTCKKHHFGCTVFTSPVWVGDKKPGKRA